MKKQRGVFGRGIRLVWRYVRAEPLTYTLSLVGATIYAGAAVGTTVVLGRVTNDVIVPAFSSGVPSDRIRGAAIALLAIGWLRALSIVLRRYFAALTTFRTQASLRRGVTDVYLDVPMAYHRSRPTGELLAHADADILGATELLNAFPFSVGVIVLIGFAVVSLVRVNLLMTLVALLLFPTLALVNRLYTKRVEAPARRAQECVGQVSRVAHESFDGAMVVKTLGRADHEIERLGAAAEQLRQARVRVGRIRAVFEPVIDAIPNVGIIILLLLGSWQVSAGQLNPGDLVQGVALFSLLAFPMRVVGFFLQEMPRAVVSIERVDRVLATESAPSVAGGAALPDGPLAVGFEHVSYAYEPGVPVLTDITFEVAPGEVVAIVGSTGSGKTTLCDLITRLADPSTGIVRIGGVDTDAIDPTLLRASVALVFQETFLFAESIADNISLGAQYAPDEIGAAARIARADEFVLALPQQYDTVVGERGVTLSGGQRQRVALARALMRKPRVLILDDATAAVDPVVEAEILAGLHEALDVTTLVVAHRVSTIELADRVLFIDAGHVAGLGSHQDLLDSRPAYGRIVRAYEAAERGMSTTLHPSEADDVSAELNEHAEGAHALAEDPIEAGVVVTQAGGALAVLRRGIKASPELRVGFRITVLMAVINAVGRIVIPVLIQQILDKGILTSGGFNAAFTLGACALALAVTIGVTVLGRTTYIRLVTAAEATLRNLRVRAFAHIHSLSVADHNEAKRGVLTSRVTSDIETIARFAQWGAIAWIVNSVVIVGVLMVMAIYSWQLALLTVVVLCPLLPLMRVLQRKQLRAYDVQRTRVGETLSAISESVMGAGVVRAYGIASRTRRSLDRTIDNQYRAETKAARYFALMFPLGDIFGATTLAAVLAVGAIAGPGWGMDAGKLVACLFLVNLILSPVAELGEILDQTQTAIAGWRKVLDVLDIPVDVLEPDPGVILPDGALTVAVEGVEFAYREAAPVLLDINVSLPAGISVAVVGETGSGKTTFAKLLCRLADPTAGRIVIGGVDLRDVAPTSRHKAVRMVPQDGFLFDATVRENVRMGRDGATDAEIEASFGALGLEWWLFRLAEGLDTQVGERGENLSVGERQLIALARAQVANPGLLILDEATSAVDPETERALSTALVRLAEGRTIVSVAHRLSTAEAADLVLVFDRGEIVEQGRHDELVGAGGRYAELYASWLGNTRTNVVSD